MALTVEAAVRRLNRASRWTTVARIPLGFACFHPQGLDRVGDSFFLTGVEILAETVRQADPDTRPDRTAGQGRGHLFELSPEGACLRHWELGEDTMYHAGGLTYDGESLWVPTAEYRPDSKSVMYRVDPRTGQVSEAFRFADHLGGVARDPGTGLLHVTNWGSRRRYVMTPEGQVVEQHESEVHSHFVDFQDCVLTEDGHILWTGVAEYPDSRGGVFQLGGIAVMDADSGELLFEVPVTELSPSGRVVTFNATHMEVDEDASVLRMYAIPDDADLPGQAHLLVLETSL